MSAVVGATQTGAVTPAAAGGIAGFGHRAAADFESVRAAFVSAQAGHPRVSAFAAPQDKTLLVSALAASFGIPMIAVSTAELQSVVTLTQSVASMASHGVGSVAEAAALAAAGPGAHLLASRHISPDRMATCAIARSGAEGSPA